MVKAIGLRVKSGWLFPSGRVSKNCVIITPGTLDFFLIPTVSIGTWNVTNNICKPVPWKLYLQDLFFKSSPTSSKSHRNTNSNMWHIRTFVTRRSASTQFMEVVDPLPSHVIYVHFKCFIFFFLFTVFSLKFKVYYIIKSISSDLHAFRGS